MYTGSSSAFNTLVMQDSRTFVALISTDSLTISEGIVSIQFNGGSNSEDDFAVGSTISQYVEIEMYGNPSLEGREFLLQIGMSVNGTNEYVPMGCFTAQKPDTDDETTKFTAYDRMMKTERLCVTSSLPETTTTIAMLNAVASSSGVPVDTSGLVSKSIARMDGLTCREVLGYVSQIYGGFAVVNRTGQIQIKTYSDSDYSVTTGRYFKTFKHNDLEIVIEKVTCVTGKDSDGNDIVISVGSGREVGFSNPYMTSELLSGVYGVLSGFAYMAGSVEFLGDPRIDPWDILTVYDLTGASFKVPCMSLRHRYDGGLTTYVDAVGKSEAEVDLNFKGPSTRYQDRTASELALIGTALVTKLDAETAAITYATITNLDATNARITELDSDYATFKSATTNTLSANTASIDTLDANYANLKLLLGGQAVTGDIQTIVLNASNATVDSAFIKNLVTQNVTVYDLAAGNISTDRITIGTDDMVISGNLIQMYDANDHLRIQMGQDANGNFTFILYDATGSGVLMDATGIKPSAISDGLIVNSMVAEDAAISGSKLDIASVISAINGSNSTINATRIYLDEAGQSLTQAYSSMSQSITVAENTANAASAAAENALQVLSGISTLDALGVVLSNDAHVVHTNVDGTGGDYRDCVTTITVYLGDTNVTSRAVFTVEASPGVTGTWNASTYTYSVSDMTTDDGYVDITALYGTEYGYMFDQDDNYITDRNGNHITARYGGSYITKRFSISKSPDGKSGVSYRIQTTVDAFSKALDGTLTPSTVTVSALYSSDASTSAYQGRFKIEESTDASTFTQKYLSSAAEYYYTYTPTAGIKVLRVTLYDSTGVTELDSKNIIALTDAAELESQITGVQQSIATINTHMTTIETSVNGLSVDIQDMSSELQGLSDGTLLFQTPYTASGDTVTFTARVYKAGENVTTDFVPGQFTWYRRTEDGDDYLGYGYTMNVDKTDMGLGGVIIGVFITRSEGLLMDRNGNYITDRNGNRISTYINEED